MLGLLYLSGILGDQSRLSVVPGICPRNDGDLCNHFGPNGQPPRILILKWRFRNASNSMPLP